MPASACANVGIETDPWGNRITHQYDAQGNLKVTTTTTGTTSRVASYGIDALNRRISVNAGGGTTQIRLDRTGLTLGLTYPNGASTNHTYDNVARLTTLSHSAAGQPVSVSSYTYDANGNRLTEAANLAANGSQSSQQRSISYSYDADDRLTQVNTSAEPNATYSVAYTLDNAGNRLSETASSATGGPAYQKSFTYAAKQIPEDNTRNQLTNLAQVNGQGRAYSANPSTNANPSQVGSLKNALSIPIT